MAMTTMPSGLTLLGADGAFRSVLPASLNHGDLVNPANALVPVNSDLIPTAFHNAFSIPHLDFDQACPSGHGSAVAAPFRMPLPFLGGSSETRVVGSALRPNPATEARPPICTGGCPAGSQRMPEPVPMAAVLHEQSQGCVDDTKPMHKPRVVWTEELHQRFLRAIDAAGSEEAAVPTVILKLMNVSGLSRDNVASHLQKHRLGLKRGQSRKRRAPAAALPKGAMNNSATGEAAAADGPSTHRLHRQASAQAIKREDTAAGEGEGQDCAGSNERDGGCNDGPSSDDGAGAGSDDGAGAGSDNRNSACNVSAAELDVKSMTSAGDGQQPGREVACGNQTTGHGQAVLGNHAENTAGHNEGLGGSKSSRSPDASRSGSNNASKQIGHSNGVSGIHGPPTAGSGTGLDTQRVQVTGAGSCVPGVLAGSPGNGAMAHSARPPVSNSECINASEDHIQRTSRAPTDVWAVAPVGVPMSLPVPPQVPAANAELMRAPRLGDDALNF